MMYYTFSLDRFAPPDLVAPFNISSSTTQVSLRESILSKVTPERINTCVYLQLKHMKAMEERRVKSLPTRNIDINYLTDSFELEDSS